MGATDYISPELVFTSPISVTYIVKDSGKKLIRTFQSEYLARKFAWKLKHSRKCRLVATSGFFM